MQDVLNPQGMLTLLSVASAPSTPIVIILKPPTNNIEYIDLEHFFKKKSNYLPTLGICRPVPNIRPLRDTLFFETI